MWHSTVARYKLKTATNRQNPSQLLDTYIFHCVVAVTESPSRFCLLLDSILFSSLLSVSVSSAFFPLTGKCTGKVCFLGELCYNYLLITCISLSNFSQLEPFAGLLLFYTGKKHFCSKLVYSCCHCNGCSLAKLSNLRLLLLASSNHSLLARFFFWQNILWSFFFYLVFNLLLIFCVWVLGLTKG